MQKQAVFADVNAWYSLKGKQKPSMQEMAAFLAYAELVGNWGEFDGKETYNPFGLLGPVLGNGQCAGPNSVSGIAPAWGPTGPVRCVAVFPSPGDAVSAGVDIWLTQFAEGTLKNAFQFKDGGMLANRVVASGLAGSIPADKWPYYWEAFVEVFYMKYRENLKELAPSTPNPEDPIFSDFGYKSPPPEWYQNVKEPWPITQMSMMLFLALQQTTQLSAENKAAFTNQTAFTRLLGVMTALSNRGFIANQATFNFGQVPKQAFDLSQSEDLQGNGSVIDPNTKIDLVKYSYTRSGMEGTLRYFIEYVPGMLEAIKSKDAGKIADVILSEQVLGPLNTKTEENWVKLKNGLKSLTDATYQQLFNTDKVPEDLMILSDFRPAWLTKTTAEKEKEKAEKEKEKAEKEKAEKEKETENLPAATEPPGMSTGTKVLIGAAVVAGGALAYSALTKKKK